MKNSSQVVNLQISYNKHPEHYTHSTCFLKDPFKNI